MNNADSFDRLITASERELRDLKTISASPFGLIKFYTKTFTTGTITSFRVVITFDPSAILPAMLTIRGDLNTNQSQINAGGTPDNMALQGFVSTPAGSGMSAAYNAVSVPFRSSNLA